MQETICAYPIMHLDGGTYNCTNSQSVKICAVEVPFIGLHEGAILDTQKSIPIQHARTIYCQIYVNMLICKKHTPIGPSHYCSVTKVKL